MREIILGVHIEIESGGDCMASDPAGTIAAALKKVAKEIEDGRTAIHERHKIMDGNGNSIGHWTICGEFE